MKKRLFISVAIVLIAIIGVVALTACDPKDTHKGKQTIEIRTAQELLMLKDNLGSDYDQFTYELMNDIDLSGENWTPLGKNYSDAFCSDFNGNGHTISGVKIYTDSAPEIRESASAIGFFGFTNNSKIKDLTLNIDYDFVYDAENIYIGGLIAYAFGDTVLSNITVNGEITANLITDYKDIKVYFGGVLGSSTGTISITNVTNNATILADRKMREDVFGDQEEANRLHTAYVGGVAGYIRTVDLSIRANGAQPAEDNIIENLVNNGDVTVYASRLNGGGIIGNVYNSTKINNLEVGAQTALLFDSALRVNAGGIIGYADNAIITDINCNAVVFEVVRVTVDVEANKIFNAGGLVGYAANRTVISDSHVDTIIMLDLDVDFAGGLVGVLADSGINNCTVKGRFIAKSPSGAMYDMFGKKVTYQDGNYTSNPDQNGDNYVRRWAGGIGKLFGGTDTTIVSDSPVGVVSDLDIDIEAYYAVKCTVVERVKAAGKDDKGEQLFQYFSSKIIKDNIVYTAEKIRDTSTASEDGNARLPLDPPEGPDDPQD